jgi:uncharacterized protein (DUF1501 family)
MISRRKFLGQASCAAIGTTTVFSTLFNLRAMNASTSFNSSIAGGGGDYKALVCLLNAGGLDSYNMLVPRDTSSYSVYAKTRSNMALPQNALRPINPSNINDKQYGLHPSLVRMQSLFEAGKLAFISNIGTLIQPTTKPQFYAGSVALPLGLYSHSDQQMHWQTGIPHARISKGWGGRIADMMVSSMQNSTVSMNISLSGNNIFQTGENTVEYSIHPEFGSIGIIDYKKQDWVFDKMKRAAIDGMVNASYQNVFKNTYTKTIKTAIDGNDLLSTVLEGAPSFNIPFSHDNDLSRSFEMIAKTISGRDKMQMSRQIFFIEYGGWDHHDELLINQQEMLTELDNALYQFNAALEQMGVSQQVTTFSLSEFARTLTSNGNGTDHGWGSNVFVMGGAVQGKKIYGNYPSLALGNTNPLEIGGGVLIPTTSTDQYFAELALWYGVPASELVSLFPNIGNFYSTTSATFPIGFLKK